MFYLCTPPLHLFPAHTHTQTALFFISISLLSLPRPPSLARNIVSLVRSFFPLLNLLLNKLCSLALLSPPFSLYSTTSPFGAPYLFHSGVQLSFIRFFRGKLRKALTPISLSFSIFIFDQFPLSLLVHASALSGLILPCFHLLGICSWLHILSSPNLNH